MRMVSEEHERRKAAAYLNPTVEAAMQFWLPEWGPPNNENVLIAGLHLGRLKWEHTTPEMAEESRRWLEEHGYSTERNFVPMMRQ